MSKGKVFTPNDLPKSQRARMSSAAQTEWANAQTERWRPVAYDPDADELIIAEELDQRILNRLSDKARRLAGTLMMAPAEVRREVLDAFEPDGSLKNPFDAP